MRKKPVKRKLNPVKIEDEDREIGLLEAGELLLGVSMPPIQPEPFKDPDAETFADWRPERPRFAPYSTPHITGETIGIETAEQELELLEKHGIRKLRPDEPSRRKHSLNRRENKRVTLPPLTDTFAQVASVIFLAIPLIENAIKNGHLKACSKSGTSYVFNAKVFAQWANTIHGNTMGNKRKRVDALRAAIKILLDTEDAQRSHLMYRKRPNARQLVEAIKSQFPDIVPAHTDGNRIERVLSEALELMYPPAN